MRPVNAAEPEAGGAIQAAAWDRLDPDTAEADDGGAGQDQREERWVLRRRKRVARDHAAQLRVAVPVQQLQASDR